jgi:hypothetical protein
MVLAGVACFSISSILSAISADGAYGAQLAKGNKIVLEKREIRNYERPRRNGNRLAFCTVDGQCGKHAADEFCRENDFVGALTFQRDRMEGHSAQLRFQRIKCWRVKGDTAAKQARAPETIRAEPISNILAKSNRRR